MLGDDKSVQNEIQLKLILCFICPIFVNKYFFLIWNDFSIEDFVCFELWDTNHDNNFTVQGKTQFFLIKLFCQDTFAMKSEQLQIIMFDCIRVEST